MPLLDIRPDHLKIVQNILQRFVPEREVWAFGSRAKWLAKEYSDLDLCIVAETPLSFRTLGLLEEAFEDSDLPYKVDVVDWAATSESFRKIIERDKVVVQEGQKGLGMANDWQASTVGDFCPFIYGKALPERFRIPGAFPVISSAGISGSHNEPLVTTSGIVIGRKGTVGSVTLSKSAFWPIDTAFYIQDEPQRDLRFTYYLLKTLGLDRMNSDSAVPGLNRDNAHTRPIFVPALPEQRAIAHILGTLDDKIELNRRMNETLEAMARALFKAWFVDFDPVRAKMDGRWLRGESLPGLPAHLYDLFPDRLVESEMGEIPEGWEITSIDNEFDVTMGQSPPGNTYNETSEGLPFYQGRADFEFRFPKRRVYCTAPTRFAKSEDTLVSVRAPVGDVNMASEDCAIGRGVAAVKHKTGSRSYTYQFMRSIADVFARFNGEGTVFGSINKKDFHAITTATPSRELVLAYEWLLAPFDDCIEKNERESRYLVQLRDTLLPKLISGELRVKDAERIAGAAV